MSTTQAYFRMCEEIWDHPCMLELMHRENGDHAHGSRMCAFLRILTLALYPSKQFSDASSLAAITGLSAKQAQRVWDTCIRHGVLRKATYGYTAREWLIENGFLGKYGSQDAEAERAYSQGVHGRRC